MRGHRHYYVPTQPGKERGIKQRRDYTCIANQFHMHTLRANQNLATARKG